MDSMLCTMRPMILGSGTNMVTFTMDNFLRQNGVSRLILDCFRHRCRVDDFVSGSTGEETEVVVQLIDYGAVEVVRLDCLLPLRRIYCELPMQAASAKLHGTC